MLRVSLILSLALVLAACSEPTTDDTPADPAATAVETTAAAEDALPQLVYYRINEH